MRIVHVVEPFASGISTFILQLTNHISEDHVIIHGIRHDSHITDDIKASFPENVKFIEWTNVKRNIIFFNDLKASIELYRLLKKLNPDIIHLHSSKAGIIGRIIAFLLRNKSVIYTPNAISFLRTDIGKYQRKSYVFIEKFASMLNGQIVSSSIGEQNIMRSEKISSILIHNGVDFSNYAFNKSEKITIVTCGRITIQKNPVAFNRIAQKFEDNREVNFVWIGSGELEHMLNSSNIRITGWLNKENVKKELSNASIYISTSEWEGLSLASLEAMAIGLPMILSNKCGNTELIDDNKNGLLYSDESVVIDKIKELIQNPELLVDLSNASRKLYENKFTGKICSEKYRELYSEIQKLNEE
jgi:glycosyltransferase involved in cell wall biosynthesis